MDKRPDLDKLLTGSPKKKAALLIQHYTILGAIKIGNTSLKPIFSNEEATELLHSFKGPKDREAYNKYRELNEDFLKANTLLELRAVSFQMNYYKYLYQREKDKTAKSEIRIIDENMLLRSYSFFYSYYTAFKFYAKKSGYTNKYILDTINLSFKLVTILCNSKEIGPELTQKFNQTEANQDLIKQVLGRVFNYNYEQNGERK